VAKKKKAKYLKSTKIWELTPYPETSQTTIPPPRRHRTTIAPLPPSLPANRSRHHRPSTSLLAHGSDRQRSRRSQEDLVVGKVAAPLCAAARRGHRRDDPVVPRPMKEAVDAGTHGEAPARVRDPRALGLGGRPSSHHRLLPPLGCLSTADAGGAGGAAGGVGGATRARGTTRKLLIGVT
jgi:hypothetical protein